MSRKENRRDIQRIMKAIEDRDVQLRNGGIQFKVFRTQVQNIKSKSKSRPRATN